MSSSVYSIPLFIDNKPVWNKDRLFDVVNAETGKVVFTAHGATEALVKVAVDSAAKAFPAWSALPPYVRREYLYKAAQLMDERKEEAIKIVCEETAATRYWGEVINVGQSVDYLKELAATISQASGIMPPTMQDNRLALCYKEPYGVVLGIAPWNNALFLAVRSVASPIAYGNTAVLRASELSPRIHHWIGEIFRDSGFPPGVLNIVQNRPEDAPEVVDALIAHPAVRKVNFTGSTMIGKIIAQKAASSLKPVLLELGGKCPQIVFADADLDKAAQSAAVAAFIHHGQVCMATDRLIVHSSVAKAFTEKFITVAKDFPAGTAVSYGQANRTEDIIQKSLDAGATLAFGDKIERVGAKLKPTVLTGVKKGMPIYHDETFGPTVGINTFETTEEAIALANDTQYGLSASIFSQNIPFAIGVARAIQSGAVHINDMSIHDEPQMPHGGVKNSGWGRFGVPFSESEFTWLKTITVTDSWLEPKYVIAGNTGWDQLKI